MIWIAAETVDISPTDGVVLGCGTGAVVNPVELIDSLEANIVVCWSEDKSGKLAVISVDSLFLGRSVTDKILFGLSRFFRSDQILLVATHTHNAPMVDETKPLLGAINPQYLEFMVREIVLATRKLEQSGGNYSSLRLRKGPFSGVVGRRNTRLFDISRNGVRFRPTLQRPSFRGLESLEFTLAEFLDSNENVIAALLVFPCHPVAYSGLDKISADVAGGIRHQYRNRVTKSLNLPFVFLQGASGELNPWWKSRWFQGGLISALDQLVNGRLFPSPPEYFSKENLRNWSKRRVEELFAPPATRGALLVSEKPNVSSSLLEIPLSNFVSSAIDLKERVVSVMTVKIESLRIIGISAELTWGFHQELRRVVGDHILVSCMRDSFGYVTSDMQYDQGGYEVISHQHSFSISHKTDASPGGELTKTLRLHLGEKI